MNINLKGTKVKFTPAIRAAIETKLAPLEKFLKPEHTVHVEIEVEKFRNGPGHRVEINIHPNNYFADARSEDMYAALDLVIPKIKRQLTKQKEKAVSMRRRSGTKG